MGCLLCCAGISYLVRIKGKTGAYFNNALVYVLLKYAACKSFLDLITEVSLAGTETG